MSALEYMETLTGCIIAEAEVIDELYTLLAQHMDPDELAGLAVVGKIQKAASMKKSLEVQGNGE